MKLMKLTVLPLLLICLLGLSLRLYRLNNIPLYGDELTIVYDTYSLLKTPGYDQTGTFLPLTFKMGAGRPAGYVYGSIPFVAVFGPGVWGVRGLSILSGLALIFIMYALGNRLLNQKVGLIAAFISAVNPWDINLSRAGFEAHLALVFALLGLLCFLKAVKKSWLLLVSGLFFGLTIHTYPTYKLTLPLLLGLSAWQFQGLLKNYFKEYKFALLLFVLILMILSAAAFFQTLKAGSETRFASINIFSDPVIQKNLEQKISYERQVTPLGPTLLQAFHNKFLEYLDIYSVNYFKNLSFDFLFLHGDGNPRHNMSLTGGFYLYEALLVFIGLLQLIRQKNSLWLHLIGWIVIAPIPTAFLNETHALRSALMMPPLIILSAFGLYNIIYLSARKKFKAMVLLLFAVVFIFQFLSFAEKLYFSSPAQFGHFWSEAAKSSVELAAKSQNKFNYVLISIRITDTEFAYPVYSQIPPSQVIRQNRYQSLLDKYQVKQYGNVYIGYFPDNEEEPLIQALPGSVFYIGTPSESQYLPGYQTALGTDSKPLFVWKAKSEKS